MTIPETITQKIETEIGRKLTSEDIAIVLLMMARESRISRMEFQGSDWKLVLTIKKARKP